MKTMTVDLAFKNTGIVVWDGDEPVHWETIQTAKTSKANLKETKRQLRVLKKAKSYEDLAPDFKYINDRPVSDIFKSEGKVFIYYKSAIDNKSPMNMTGRTVQDFMGYLEDIVKCEKVTYDKIRRTNELTTRLVELINEYDIEHIIAEMSSGAQSASALDSMARATATLTATIKCFNLFEGNAKFDYVTQQQVKMAMCNDKQATKYDMMLKAKMLYPNCEFPKQIYIFEHIADAIAVKLAYNKYLC